MKIYAVHSQFYDNGKVTAYTRQYELPEKPENKYTEHRDHDAYVDYYTSKKEADKACEDIRREINCSGCLF